MQSSCPKPPHPTSPLSPEQIAGPIPAQVLTPISSGVGGGKRSEIAVSGLNRYSRSCAGLSGTQEAGSLGRKCQREKSNTCRVSGEVDNWMENLTQADSSQNEKQVLELGAWWVIQKTFVPPLLPPIPFSFNRDAHSKDLSFYWKAWKGCR